MSITEHRVHWALATVAVAAALTWSVTAQERDRSTIAPRYTWNLSDLYPNETAWQAARDQVRAEFPKLRDYEGRLLSSAATLADALELRSRLSKDYGRLATYAARLADQDTRDAAHQGMRQEMQQLGATLGAQSAYIEPEILKADRATLERYVSTEPRLKPYDFYLHDVLRRTAHTLSDAEERLLADAGPVLSTPSSVFTILSNADFPYPSVTLSDGRTVTINQARYNELRAVANRSDREKVMSAFFTSLGTFGRTFGTMMNGEVQAVLFGAKARHYPTALEATLDEPNIPTSVYTRLIDGVNRHLPAFHRYLQLRKRMMGVETLHYYDLYAPLVPAVDRAYTAEEAQALVLGAVERLGADYQATIRRAFDDRWIDLYPTPGKVSGAYSSGSAYDVHPYMLINYNGKYDDVSTLAHELGHTMQSYYSNRTQPYPLAGYPIFVAEVASTFNESLLNDYMLRTVRDDRVRLSLLGSYLENLKGTVFRQTQFAEFELRMHEMAARGDAITGAALDKLYLDITRRYYGHDQGICVVDDYIAHEWSFVPHFYRDFYVFQYATSFTASEALAQKVKAGSADATRKYLAFLSAGGSKYPIDLLKDAGVDMTTDEPLDLTIATMNRVMDQMEALLQAR